MMSTQNDVKLSDKEERSKELIKIIKKITEHPPPSLYSLHQLGNSLQQLNMLFILINNLIAIRENKEKEFREKLIEILKEKKGEM